MIGSLDALAAPPTPAARHDPQRTRAAASEFEALLMGSLLKTMREAGSSGWLGTGDDKASESLLELAEQQLAQLLAAQGGLGLARLVVDGLSKSEPPDRDTKPPGSR